MENINIIKPSKRTTLQIYRRFNQNSLSCLEELTDPEIDMYHLSLFGKNFFLVMNPDIIEQILATDYEIFDKTMKGVDSYKGKTLLAPPGDKIRTKVHIARPKLTREYQEKYLSSMQKILLEEIERITLLTEKNNIIDIHAEIEYILLRIIFKEFLSIDVNEDSRYIGHYIHDISVFMKKRALAIFKMPRFVPTKRNRIFNMQSSKIDEWAESLISGRMKLEVKPDDLLTEIVSKKDESGNLRNYNEMYNDLLTLFPAAYETPAKAISFTLFNILSNPSILSKVLSDTNISPKPSELFERVVEESLRMYPPVWIMSRTNTKSVKIKDFVVNSGSVFLFSQYQMHRHPLYWKKPQVFNPDRFLNGNEPLHPFAYFPFGGGPSRCVGKQFAYRMIPEVIKALITNFEFELVNFSDQIEIETGVTIFPKNGIPVFTRRKNNAHRKRNIEEKIVLEEKI